MNNKDWDTINTPPLDSSTIERMERGAGSTAVGQQRRICLALMGRSLEQLNQSSISDPDVFAELLQMAREFLSHAKALVEVAEAAVFRMELADERGNTKAVLASRMGSKKGGKKARNSGEARA